tara:strand:+ start:1009 stop:1782 length:774 start_codon:yes stop_codon:yes gene_type:complete
MAGFLNKLQILFNSRKIFKNWYIYPIIYFKLTKNKYAIFEAKSGQKIKIRVNSTDLMALTHVWMIQEYYANNFEIKDDDDVIDIGAHIGLFALYASQFCKNGRIFCFEPIEENYNLLLENIKLNDIKNIIPFNLAVSDKISKIKIYLNNDESGHSIFLNNEKSVLVNSTTLENIFTENHIDNCNFLKLDCEGAEYQIIDSLNPVFFGKISKTIIEYHLADTNPELLENLTQKLDSHNFKIKIKKLFSDIGFLFANST